MGSVIFFLSLYFVGPVFVAKVVLGSTWHAILVGYAIWFAALLLWGFSAGRNFEEGLGWAIIMGMFLTMIALPIIAVALRAVGVR